MSGWDQKYDLQDWARDVQHQAERLQKTNKVMRWMYLISAVLLTVVGVVLGRGFPIAIAVFFALLFVWNEHLIRKMRKAGIK